MREGRSLWTFRAPRPVLGGAALACFVIYAAPLLVPPPPRWPKALAPETSLIDALFPEVPAWWVVGRLMTLLVGAGIVARFSRHSVMAGDSGAAPAGAVSVPRGWWIVALLAAAAHVSAIPWIASLSHAGQAAYLLWLVVPGSLLAVGAQHVPSPDKSAVERAPWAVTGTIVVLWVLSRLWLDGVAWRAADAVDMWRGFAQLTHLATEGGNFLIETPGTELPGVNAVPMFFEGLPLLQALSRAPDLQWVQTAHAILLAVAALALADVARRLFRPSSAPVVAAVFLFSPFVLMAQMAPMPVSVLFLYSALVVWLAVRFRATGSPADLAFYGAVAGLAVTNPSLVPLTGVTALVVLKRLWGSRGLRLAAVTALACAVAAIAPSVPDFDTLAEMRMRYLAPHWPWLVAERAILGQVSPAPADWLSGQPPPAGTIPISAFLAPFAVPRSGMRLIGDTLLDPIGAFLVATGLCMCLRHFRRRDAALLLALTGAALVTGAFSNLDRVSLIRIAGSPVPLALLAGLGFSAVRTLSCGEIWRRCLPWLTVVAVVAAGTTLFDVVNPRILPGSSLGVAFRALGGETERAALLSADRAPVSVVTEHRDVDWLRAHLPELLGEQRPAPYAPIVGRQSPDVGWLRRHHPYIREILRAVPASPVPVVLLEHLEQRRAPLRRLLFWGRGLEERAEVSRRLCDVEPGLRLYTIRDRAGLSVTYAAAPLGESWTPAVPAAQWRARRCRESAG